MTLLKELIEANNKAIKYQILPKEKVKLGDEVMVVFGSGLESEKTGKVTRSLTSRNGPEWEITTPQGRKFTMFKSRVTKYKLKESEDLDETSNNEAIYYRMVRKSIHPILNKLSDDLGENIAKEVLTKALKEFMQEELTY